MTSSMHLFLTGGTGFVGKALLRYWQAEKAKPAAEQNPTPASVTVLSRDPEGFLAHHKEWANLPWLHFHWGDMLMPGSLPAPAAFPYASKAPPAATAFSHILHAATDSTRGAQLPPMQRYSQIASGTRHILEWAIAHGQHHGTPPPRLLYMSSGAVYGTPPQHMERIPEHYPGMPDPLDPNNVYGIAKRSAEHLCALYAQQHGMETVIARCFAFVGRDLPQDAHFAIGNFIRDALTRPAITVTGDGSPVRSYMDQRDLAYWLTTLLLHGKAGHAYNVGSEASISIAQAAVQVRNLLAPGKAIQICANNTANNPQRLRYLPDTRKARETLELGLRYSLADAVQEVAKHLK